MANTFLYFGFLPTENISTFQVAPQASFSLPPGDIFGEAELYFREASPSLR